MRILFEEHHYEPAKLRPLLAGLEEANVHIRHVEHGSRLSMDYVGYYYNPELEDCVFVLPKVLMDETGRVLADNGHDGFDPEELMEADLQKTASDDRRRQLLEFVYGFSVWVYRGISVYREKNTDSDIASSPNVTQMGHGRRRDRYTFLDIILELLQFNRREQDYLTFVVKNLHRGANKINWTRTIAKSQAIIERGRPIYIDPVNKKREANWDEELLVIFYSVLHHIQAQYGFRVRLNANFDLITGERFEHYLKGYGQKRLRQIKYKYFADKALRIWELCYAFFDAAYKVAIHHDTRDYLLVHDFHAVFEEMVDELLSDKTAEIEKLKKQEDGKRLDHIYRHYGLTEHADKEETYYIGDSKYYPRKASVGRESVAKQFTYARNLVQYNLDLLMDGEEGQKYRDEETEGYDVVPNFFISAQVPTIGTEGYADSSIRLRNAKADEPFYISRHFDDRLFDRDTILVAHYDVNFLYVLALYARNNEGEKRGWRKTVREQLRKEIREELKKKYAFFAMRAAAGGEAEGQAFLKSHFQEVLGKIYRPTSESETYMLALEASNDGTDEEQRIGESDSSLIAELRKHFYITPCEIGKNPEKEIKAYIESGAPRPTAGNERLVVVVRCKNKEQEEWILNHGRYNLPLETIADSPIMDTAYLLIDNGKKSRDLYKKVKSKYDVWTKQQMLDAGYPNPSHDAYLILKIHPLQKTEEPLRGKIFDLTNLPVWKSKKYMPYYFVKLGELLNNIVEE